MSTADNAKTPTGRLADLAASARDVHWDAELLLREVGDRLTPTALFRLRMALPNLVAGANHLNHATHNNSDLPENGEHR